MKFKRRRSSYSGEHSYERMGVIEAYAALVSIGERLWKMVWDGIELKGYVQKKKPLLIADGKSAYFDRRVYRPLRLPILSHTFPVVYKYLQKSVVQN